MRHFGTWLLGATLMTGCGKSAQPPASASAAPPPGDAAKAEAAKKEAETAQRMREMLLRTPVAQLGIQKSDDFPRIYAVLMDWPIGTGNIASIVGMCDGNASLYTNSTFGIIGGVGHAAVRRAAIDFVKAADRFYGESEPTAGFPYPFPDRIRFYLATFDGVRVIDADLNATASGQGKYSALFTEGQKLLTALRLTEKQPA